MRRADRRGRLRAVSPENPQTTASTSWFARNPARWREVFHWVVVFGVLAGVRAWQTRDVVRGAAPPLHGRTPTGATIDLAALRGGPVAVHFWATWCGVCAMEADNVESLARGGRVLTVASASGSAAEVARYAAAEGLHAPILVDEASASARAWGVTGYPTTFFLDGDGTIRHVEVGYTTTLGMRARLALAGLGW